ncbi:hypothetical protein DL93DRAFT_443406 [Clavulina sp. PMI_390]|nr:hypothetical protein DL93DRAFT_443406 [Clavulina sp. PMI_390]
MMEVEEAHTHGLLDQDMMGEDGLIDYGDDIMQDEHGVIAPEVEMGHDTFEDGIEYDMEDASEHTADYSAHAAEPVASVPESVSSDAAPTRPKTPPATEGTAPDVVFDSPSHSKVPEPSTLASTTSNIVEAQTPAPTQQPDSPAPPATLPASAEPEHDSEAEKPSPTNVVVEQSHLASSEPPQVTDPGVAAAPGPPQEEHEEAAEEPVASTTDQDPSSAVDPPVTDHEAEHAVEEGDDSVYFPSPVLVTSSTESHLPFYLFAAPEGASDEVIHLADQPELFFQPLHSVFEALRGLSEELNIPTHVELALYCDGLDLNITEVRYSFFI